VIPAKKIFNDIRRQIYGTVQLASRNLSMDAAMKKDPKRRLESLGTNQSKDELNARQNKEIT